MILTPERSQGDEVVGSMTNTYTVVDIDDDDAMTIAGSEDARRHLAAIATF